MFELPISSEVAGLVNFLACELIVMSYIMLVTSMIAGSLNYVAIAKGTTLSLRVFDIPHVGGGLVMNTSISRWILIFIRFSLLAAITVSNFGLEGRTRDLHVAKEAIIRRPGRITELNTATLFSATERRMRCAHTEGDDLVFGAVIDGQCYPELSTDVHVRAISLNFTQFNASAVGCTYIPEPEFHFTRYSCRDVDITCKGLISPDETDLELGRCLSVIYERDWSWLCPVHSALPGVVDAAVECRRIRAHRRDIELWHDIYMYRTDDLETAVFGAAYGVEERRLVEVPSGSKNVTVVTIFWLAPAAYELLLVWVVTIWGISLSMRGAKTIGNDERGLARLLRRKLDLKMLQMSDWFDETGPLQTLHRSLPDEEEAYP